MESNNINFLVVGHVDTGKSTMLGKILALTNHISEHELNKMKQEAEFNGKKKFHYAYVLDTDTIERQRGITQSYNMVDFNYNNQKYTLIDTPGHKSYVTELIEVLTNTKNINVCYMVSCIENEFNSSISSGQLLENLLLIRGSNVNNIMIVINKIDMVPLETLQQQYNNIKNKLTELLKKTGFKVFSFLPISGYEGWNILDENKSVNDLIKPQYTTFFQSLHCLNEIQSSQIIIKPDKINKNKIKVLFNAYNLNKIITIAHNFILHIIDCDKTVIGEIKVINSIDNNKQLFIKNGDKVYLGLQLDSNINVYDQQKIIFRSDDKTIGFGKILVQH